MVYTCTANHSQRPSLQLSVCDRHVTWTSERDRCTTRPNATHHQTASVALPSPLSSKAPPHPALLRRAAPNMTNSVNPRQEPTPLIAANQPSPAVDGSPGSSTRPASAPQGPQPAPATTTAAPSANGFLPALAALQSALQAASVQPESRPPAVTSSASSAIAPVSSLIHSLKNTPSSRTLASPSISVSRPTQPTNSSPSLPIASENASDNAPKSTSTTAAKPFIITGSLVLAFLLAIAAYTTWRKSTRKREAYTPKFSPMFGGRTPPGFNGEKGTEAWQKFEDSQTSLPVSTSAARDFAPPSGMKTATTVKPASGAARPYSATPPSALLAQQTLATSTTNGSVKAHGSVKKQEISKPQPPAPIGLGFDSKTTAGATLSHYSIQVPTKPAPTPSGASPPLPTKRVNNDKGTLSALLQPPISLRLTITSLLFFSAMSILMTGVGAGASMAGHVQIQQINVARQASVKNNQPLLVRKPSESVQPMLARKPSGKFTFNAAEELRQRLSVLVTSTATAPTSTARAAPAAASESYQRQTLSVPVARQYPTAGSTALTTEQTKALSSALGLATEPNSPAVDLDLYRYTRHEDLDGFATPSRTSFAPSTRMSLYTTVTAAGPPSPVANLMQLPLPRLSVEFESPNPSNTLGQLMLEIQSTPRIVVEALQGMQSPLAHSHSHARGMSMSTSHRSQFDDDSDDESVVIAPVRKVKVEHRLTPIEAPPVAEPAVTRKQPTLNLAVTPYSGSSSSPALPYLTQEDAPPSPSPMTSGPPPSRIPVAKSMSSSAVTTQPLSIPPRARPPPPPRSTKRASLLPKLDFPLPPVTIPTRPKT